MKEALFHEKQILIENCLFGVDINPNSVKICRLRLWIELLKNAYYRVEEGVLETLPNIDINIKTGNSLISRFALDADLKAALRGTNWNINDYKIAVAAYKEVSNKEQKHQLVKLIDSIKSNFSTKFYTYSKENKDLNKLRGEQTNLLTTNIDLFGAKKAKKDLALEAKRLELAIGKKEQEIEEIKNNKIYENAFEWRFEFPEVLNDEGDFVGFDVVIGNPPYISIQELKIHDHRAVDYYRSNYETIKQGNFDIYIPFIELLYSISKSGTFIIPSKFFTTEYGMNIREFLLNKIILTKVVDFGHNLVFESASVYTCILFLEKKNNEFVEYLKTGPNQILINELKFSRFLLDDLKGNTWTFSNSKLTALIKGTGKFYPGFKFASRRSIYSGDEPTSCEFEFRFKAQNLSS